MYRHRKRIALLILIAFFGFAGCSGLKRPGWTADGKGTGEKRETVQSPDTGSGNNEEPENSYYYFIMAEDQIRKGDLDNAINSLEKAVNLDPSAIDLKKELALVYIQKDEMEKALGLAGEILEMEPDNVEALIITASIRQAMGDAAAAERAYEKVLTRAPERKNIYLVLGRLYMQDRNYDKAVAVFLRLVNRYPEDYTGIFYLGKAYAGLGNEQKAIDAFNKTLALQPGLLESYAELIRIYSGRKDETKVIEIYETVLEQHPDNVPAKVELGLLYRKHMRPQASRTFFAELGRQAETDRTVINVIIQNLVAQKRYDDAIAVLDGMLFVTPGNQDLHYLAGVTEYLMNRFDGALAHLKKVEPDSRFYADAAIQQAAIYSHKNQQDEAITVLEKALDKMGNAQSAEKIQLIKYLSAFYSDRGDFQIAVDLLHRGLSIDRANTDLLYELGVSYDRMGQQKKAVEQMQKVIELDPEHADALNYLGYTYADAGVHLDKAETLIRKAMKLKPDNGYILDSMGWVRFKQGRFAEAIGYLEKAAVKEPDDPTILEHLGDAYIKRNQTGKALEIYQRALLKKEANKAVIEGKINEIKPK